MRSLFYFILFFIPCLKSFGARPHGRLYMLVGTCLCDNGTVVGLSTVMAPSPLGVEQKDGVVS